MTQEIDPTSQTVANSNELFTRIKTYQEQVTQRLTPRSVSRTTLSRTKNDVLGGKNDEFRIEYQNTQGSSRWFTFTLLPAIDITGRGGIGNVNVGSMGMIPEVKPGIVIRTTMKQKNIVIPGGTPVVQTIGVDNTIMQLVGSFVGTELDTGSGSAKKQGDLSTLYYGYDSDAQQQPSTDKAEIFRNEVVYSGRPVTVVLQTEHKAPRFSKDNRPEVVRVRLKHRGVVIGFKYYAQRVNRTYYTLDLLLTDYNSVL